MVEQYDPELNGSRGTVGGECHSNRQFANGGSQRGNTEALLYLMFAYLDALTSGHRSARFGVKCITDGDVGHTLHQLGAMGGEVPLRADGARASTGSRGTCTLISNNADPRPASTEDQLSFDAMCKSMGDELVIVPQRNGVCHYELFSDWFSRNGRSDSRIVPTTGTLVDPNDVGSFDHVFSGGGWWMARPSVDFANGVTVRCGRGIATVRDAATRAQQRVGDTKQSIKRRTAGAQPYLSAFTTRAGNTTAAVVHNVQRFRYRKRSTRARAAANEAIAARNSGPSIIPPIEEPVERSRWFFRRAKTRGRRLDAVEAYQQARYNINNNIVGVRSTNAVTLAAKARTKFGHSRMTPAQNTIVRRYIASCERPSDVSELDWPILIDNATFTYFQATDTDLARGAMYTSTKFKELNEMATLPKA